ncbi:MAG TPA: ATP-binding protein [Solimonas sp.]|nr:ATP-binding protein [Solimonas sp.]
MNKNDEASPKPDNRGLPTDPEAARALLAAVIDSADDAIVTKTLTGQITSWNRAAERLFGYTAEEAIGQSITMLIPDERRDEETMILARLRRGERVDHFETVRRAKDGRLIDISLTISPVRDDSGTIIGASKIARDNSERRRLQSQAEDTAAEREALLASERSARAQAEHLSAVKDEFLATLSHELRTPISAILGWAQLLKRPGRTAQDLEQGHDTIERNARLQARLIEDLLDMSRITSGKVRLDVQMLQPSSIIEAAVESLRPTAEARNVRLEVVLDSRAGPVRGDPSRLQQVAWNLLSNAIKFSNKGGRVQVALCRINSHVEIVVADTGIGIQPEFLPHVFERFRQGDASTTRSHGGLGLGLAIVKRLVEMHGGLVRAESAGLGRGATFTVILPVAIMQHEEPRESGRASTSVQEEASFSDLDLGGIRILVVDDELDARELIQRVLQECHATVVTAASAAEALPMLDSARPDLLISDIGMPEVDGYELLRRVRARGPEHRGSIPAIALTAFARSEDRTRALRAGFLVHVAKPVEASELVATVAAVVGQVRSGDRGGSREEPNQSG